MSSATNTTVLPMTNHQFMDAEIICPKTMIDKMYFAISAAVSAINFRFSYSAAYTQIYVNEVALASS